MIEGTSGKWESYSSEWYSEECYDSSPQFKPFPRSAALHSVRAFGMQAALAQFSGQQIKVGILDEWAKQVAKPVTDGFKAIRAALLKATKTQNDYVLTSRLGITIKPRAHSMAPPPGARIFDHRGRKRY